jgi:hypothetical protein
MGVENNGTGMIAAIDGTHLAVNELNVALRAVRKERGELEWETTGYA